MREVIEADIDIFGNQGGHLKTKESKARFCKFIIEHYLRKFHCLFLFAPVSSNHFLCLDAAHPSAGNVPVSAPARLPAPPPTTTTPTKTAEAFKNPGTFISYPNPPPPYAAPTFAASYIPGSFKSPSPPPYATSTTAAATDEKVYHRIPSRLVPHLDTRRSLNFNSISRDLRKFHCFYLHSSHIIAYMQLTLQLGMCLHHCQCLRLYGLYLSQYLQASAASSSKSRSWNFQSSTGQSCLATRTPACPNPLLAGASITAATTNHNASHRICLIPHLDTRNSLRFDTISRDLKEGDCDEMGFCDG